MKLISLFIFVTLILLVTNKYTNKPKKLNHFSYNIKSINKTSNFMKNYINNLYKKLNIDYVNKNFTCLKSYKYFNSLIKNTPSKSVFKLIILNMLLSIKTILEYSKIIGSHKNKIENEYENNNKYIIYFKKEITSFFSYVFQIAYQAKNHKNSSSYKFDDIIKNLNKLVNSTYTNIKNIVKDNKRVIDIFEKYFDKMNNIDEYKEFGFILGNTWYNKILIMLIYN